MVDSIQVGQLNLTISAFVPTSLVVLEKLKLALDEYAIEPFSLDRRSKYCNKYGSEVITIMRRYGELYPSFLKDKFFAFHFADAQRLSGSLNKIGLTITHNKNGYVSTMAVAKFIQILFQVFDMDDTAFVTPTRLVEMRGGGFTISEIVAVTKYKITDKKVFDWLKAQTKLMDDRNAKKEKK